MSSASIVLVVMSFVIAQLTCIEPTPITSPFSAPAPDQPSSSSATALLNTIRDNLDLDAALQRNYLLHRLNESPGESYIYDLEERLRALNQDGIGMLTADDKSDMNSPEKRAWQSMGGAWGKRVANNDNWNKFRGMYSIYI